MPASVATNIAHVNDVSNMVSQKRALMVCGRSDRKELNGDPTNAKISLVAAILLLHLLIMPLSRVRQRAINLHMFSSSAGLTAFSAPPEANGDAAWHPPNGAAQGSATAIPAPSSMPTFPPPPPPPEGGYYPPPYFYPPPPGFVPPSDGQATLEGSPNSGAPPPPMPYYMPPPGYYGPPYYGPPGVMPPTMDPAQAELQRTSGPPVDPDPDVEEIPPPAPAPKAKSKKRSRVGKDGLPKAKKTKVAAVVQESSTSSGTTGGSDQASEPGHGSPAENGDA